MITYLYTEFHLQQIKLASPLQSVKAVVTMFVCPLQHYLTLLPARNFRRQEGLGGENRSATENGKNAWVGNLDSPTQTWEGDKIHPRKLQQLDYKWKLCKSFKQTLVNAVRKKSPLNSRGSRVKKLLVSPTSVNFEMVKKEKKNR